jgi:hypothetical protein
MTTFQSLFTDSDMKTGITKQDFTLLLEAIEVWEKEDTGPPIMAHVMVGMLNRGDQDAQDRIESLMNKRQAAADAERRMRKERGVMLRAKLITLRDSIDAEDFIASVQP